MEPNTGVEKLLKNHPQILSHFKDTFNSLKVNGERVGSGSTLSGGFIWGDSTDGNKFWAAINQSNFNVYYEKYAERPLNKFPDTTELDTLLLLSKYK